MKGKKGKREINAIEEEEILKQIQSARKRFQKDEDSVSEEDDATKNEPLFMKKLRPIAQ